LRKKKFAWAEFRQMRASRSEVTSEKCNDGVEARSGDEIDGILHSATSLHRSPDVRDKATPPADFGFISIIYSFSKRLEKRVGATLIAVYLELSFESAIQFRAGRPCCRRSRAKIVESFLNV
jgi:hypothetical protein